MIIFTALVVFTIIILSVNIKVGGPNRRTVIIFVTLIQIGVIISSFLLSIYGHGIDKYNYNLSASLTPYLGLFLVLLLSFIIIKKIPKESRHDPILYIPKFFAIFAILLAVYYASISSGDIFKEIQYIETQNKLKTTQNSFLEAKRAEIYPEFEKPQTVKSVGNSDLFFYLITNNNRLVVVQLPEMGANIKEEKKYIILKNLNKLIAHEVLIKLINDSSFVTINEHKYIQLADGTYPSEYYNADIYYNNKLVDFLSKN